MAKTIEQLKAQSAEIKNATSVGENTATRVGTLFTDIVEHVEHYEVEQAKIFDVSVYNNGAVFESIQALLCSSNLSTLIPTSVRHGGMTIRFIQGSEQGSDNKYVQYRLKAQDFTTDTTQWVIADEGVYVENPEFFYVQTDKDDKILWAIKTDGSIYYGAGVPKQIKDYIEYKISSLSLDEYEDIVKFLSDYIGSDTTLKTLLDSKLDAEGLDADALEILQSIKNQEYFQITTDIDNKIFEGITSKGIKQINIPIDTPSAAIVHIENPEWMDIETDIEGRIIEGTRKNGKKVFFGGIEGLEEKIQNTVNNTINTEFTNKYTTDKFSEQGDQLLWNGEPIKSGSISSLVVDLPVSDGTDIESGYAYIDITDRVVRVKA